MQKTRFRMNVYTGCPECLYGISFNDLNCEQQQHPAIVQWKESAQSTLDEQRKQAEEEFDNFRTHGDIECMPTIAADISRRFSDGSHFSKLWTFASEKVVCINLCPLPRRLAKKQQPSPSDTPFHTWPGALVVLTGLISGVVYNGRRVEVLRFIPATGRYEVQIADPREKARKAICVKPANLMKLLSFEDNQVGTN